MATVINTPRFKGIQIQPEKIFVFPQGIIGFEAARDFVLIDRGNGNSFLWLQSLKNPDLCFLLIEPEKVIDAYHPELSSQDRIMLEASNGKDVTFLNLVTVDESHENIYINLKSPIAINSEKRIGIQVILEDERYPVRHQLTTRLKSSGNAKKLEKSVVKAG